MIYKSSCAYSFGKGEKKTESSFMNKTINNPGFYKYQGEIIKKPTKGYSFSKSEKFKMKGHTQLLSSFCDLGNLIVDNSGSINQIEFNDGYLFVICDRKILYIYSI